MLGEFNSIRHPGERRETNQLEENMVESKFTCYKLNGSEKSRLDRVMVSIELLSI